MAKYNSKIIREICNNVAKGSSNKDAALLAGISEETFYVWLREKPEFSESLKKAEAKRKATLIGTIFEASKKQWTAAAWYLERVYPNEFGSNREIIEKPEEKGQLVSSNFVIHFIKRAREEAGGETNIDKIITKLEEEDRLERESSEKSEISNKKSF